MASDLSAGVRVPSMHPYRCIRVPDGVKIVMHLSAIMYEPAGVRKIVNYTVNAVGSSNQPLCVGTAAKAATTESQQGRGGATPAGGVGVKPPHFLFWFFFLLQNVKQFYFKP